ncbi:MAG: RICIN domain-containing protein [Firmicutes bacterium]|nr:RICIN domain-containing protein [Bacillota bacterium]
MKKKIFIPLFVLCGLYGASATVHAQEDVEVVNEPIIEKDPETDDMELETPSTEDAEEAQRLIMNQLVDPNTGKYVYTPSAKEKEEYVKNGWTYEGTSWIAPSNSPYPVLELIDPDNGHFYTMDVNEYNKYILEGWTPKGICWYSSLNEEVAVFRVYNENLKTYYYTTDFEEYMSMKTDGWIRQGISWYGWKITDEKRFDEYRENNKNTIGDGYYSITSKDTNKNLGTNSSGNAILMDTVPLWKFENLENGFVKITNEQSGKALSVADQSKYEGVSVIEALFENAQNQLWIVENTANGYLITSALQERYVLDANGNLITVLTGSNASSEYWNIERVLTEREKIDAMASSNQTLNNGIYTIYIYNKENFSLTPQNGSSSDKANVQTETKNDSHSQTWIIRNTGNGYYTIENYLSKMVLTVDSATLRANVYQTAYGDGYNQKWLFVKSDNGSYVIKSALDPSFVIDLNTLSIKSGDNCFLYTEDGSEYQFYTLNLIGSLLEEGQEVEYTIGNKYVDPTSGDTGTIKASFGNISTNGFIKGATFIVSSSNHTAQFSTLHNTDGFDGTISLGRLGFDVGEYIVQAKLLFDNGIERIEEIGKCMVGNVLDTLQTNIESYIASKSKGNWQVYFKMVDGDNAVSINEGNSQQSASVIKLFVMGTVYDHYEELCAYKSKSSVDSYLKQMITVSSNDAWKGLVSWLGKGSYSTGCNIVTEWARLHGYDTTYTEGASYHNFTSAKDSATFINDVYNNRFSHSADMLALLLQQQRTSKIPAGVPSGTLTGNKTGELADNVYHTENDAAIIYAPNGTYVLSVLSTGITNSVAQTVIKQISAMVYNFFN